MWSRLRNLPIGKSLAAIAMLNPAFARVGLLLLAGVITFLALTLFRAPLGTFEERVGEIAWRLNPDTETEERINIIAIDEKSIEQLGAWPWSRVTMAKLADALAAAGAQLQLYDVVFAEAREGDSELLTALLAAPAAISQLPDLQASQQIKTGQLTHALNGIACNNSTLNTASSYIANNADFAAVPKGHIAALIDTDGAVRKVPAVVCVDGKVYPALSISALLLATGSPRWEASLNKKSGIMAAQQQLQLAGYPGLNIPLDAVGNMRVSFRKAPEAYRAFSAVDVINGNINAEELENTWALIGYTAFGLVDIVPTPFDGAAPGVEIQARILGSVLDNEVPYTPARGPLLLACVSVMFGLLLFALSGTREKATGYLLAVCGLLFPLLALVLHIQLLASVSIWLGWLCPSLYSLLAAGLLLLHEYARVKLERGRLMSNLSSYLPVDIAKEIAYSLPNSSIVAHRQSVTLLSADLRNFSAYTESRPPEESAALLHFFFVRATEIIESHKGQVHEFKGDSLLALWTGSDEQSATNALQAALVMQRTIQEVLPQTPPQGLEPLALGIGIEQGPVLVGSIGPAHRRSHTLLGETVTIALRIQDMTIDLAQPILIGECAARQLPDQHLQSQGSYLLNGLQTPHTLFAPSQSLRAAGKQQSEAPSLKLLHGGRH